MEQAVARGGVLSTATGIEPGLMSMGLGSWRGCYARLDQSRDALGSVPR